MTRTRTGRRLTAGLLPLGLILSAAAPATALGPEAGPAKTAAPTAVHLVKQVRAHPRFDDPRPNPWFPLQPGTTTVLRGTDEGRRMIEHVRVTHRHKIITGVRTTVVRDELRRSDGSLAERTTDWYAPDNAGDVWYLGERTATYDRHGGLASREGSWQAGRHGARMGLIMPADPRPTDAYRQEYFKGHAEDQAWIVSRRARVTTPVRQVTHGLQTFEWTRLEPGVVSVKIYARGIGIITERDIAGGSESFAVVAIHHP